jgi:hypothetical protein
MGSNRKTPNFTDTEATAVVGQTREVTRRHGVIVVTEPGIGTRLSAEEVKDIAVSVLGAKCILITGDLEAFNLHLQTGCPISITEWVVLAKDLGTWAMELEFAAEGPILVVYREFEGEEDDADD